MTIALDPTLHAAIRSGLRLTIATRLVAFGAEDVLHDADVAAVAHLALVADPPAIWPAAGPTVSIAADRRRLPFIEAMFDIALVIDRLDKADPGPPLRELWRVLAPAGTMLLAVPARFGGPLAFANPLQPSGYSRGGLERILAAAMFEPLDWTTHGGVHLVRAAKSDGLAPIEPGSRATVRRAAAANGG